MDKRKKPSKKPVIVTKPYLTGRAVDNQTVKSALKFFGGLVVMCLAYLLLGSMMIWDSLALRIITNGAVIAMVMLLFYNSGAVSGTGAVNQGEIMYQRKESGRQVDDTDVARCFHPMKGIVAALIGSIPLVVCALILALTAQIQTTGLSTLPSWISGYERRAEFGNALAFYHQATTFTFGDGLRLVIRMAMMPLVTIVGSSNRAGILLLEQLSPLVSLLPALFYGFGYMRGVAVRTRVHSDIAANKRKRAKKERKQRQARAAKAPEQLN